ncbi:uncharacterized protein SCHCODRAFT_02499043, partial [Schizophyllum commune H4-8]|uniref:uncharacterized protein n=1 Tax=Schizophyllum commune (strain H4-8 / FGSC 9210) TaxID=578458 RepID=UPI0021606FE7
SPLAHPTLFKSHSTKIARLPLTLPSSEHRPFGLPPQEELAKRQVAAHQDNHGQARPLVLSVVHRVT